MDRTKTGTFYQGGKTFAPQKWDRALSQPEKKKDISANETANDTKCIYQKHRQTSKDNQPGSCTI